MGEVNKTSKGEIFDPSKYEGANGFEETYFETFKMPFLKIIQALSPERDKNDIAYLPDAEVGDFCNTVSKELSSELTVVVLKIVHELIVWKPERKGIAGVFSKKDEPEIVARVSGKKKWDKDGNDVIDTITFFCTRIDKPSDIFAFPLSVTSFKYGTAFASKLRMLEMEGKPVGVSWAGVWSIATVEDRNEKGRWMSLGNTPKFVRFVTSEEVENHILPAVEMLKRAEVSFEDGMDTEYAAGDAAEAEEEVHF